MFNLRRLLAVLILVAVLAVGIAIWRHLQQRSPLEILEALPEQIDLSLEQLHYTHNEEGKRSWTLDADKAEYRRDEGQALLDAVHLTLYDAGKFGEVTLIAKQGRLEQEKQQVEVWGKVEVVTARGEHLYTERLHYDGQQQLITSADPVRMVSPRMELTGTGLWVDVDRGLLRVEKDVWLMLLPKEGK